MCPPGDTAIAITQGLRHRQYTRQPTGRNYGDGDRAGGSAKRISLSTPGFLPWLCCQIPAFLMLGSMLVLVIALYACPPIFIALSSLLTAYVYLWIAGTAFFCLVAVDKIRRTLAVDWDQRLKEFAIEKPEEFAGAYHVVILHNYEEQEHVIAQTLDNLASGFLAKERMLVVLAMEQREGPDAYRKAEALCSRFRDRFADIFATFHPTCVPGEAAGKSSNTQWAFREVQRRYAPQFADTGKVFLTVGDADSLWHPKYFAALMVQGLSMPVEEREWVMFQPPVLRLRNYSNVSAFNRVSGFVTCVHEIAGLAGQWLLGPYMAFSTYSMTFALANHPLVDGWDTDVIAEDRHMFSKCLFASLWVDAEQAGDNEGVKMAPKPKVKVRPIYLPVVLDMLRSTKEYVALCEEKLHQSRIAELAFVVLQYIYLIRAVSFRGLPVSAHKLMLSLTWKMITIHLVSAIHGFALMLTSHAASVALLTLAVRGELWDWLTSELPALLANGPGTVLGFQYWFALAMLVSVVPVSMIIAHASFAIVRDCLEGAWEAEAEATKVMSKAKQAALWLYIWFDMAVLGEVTLVIYGLVPEVLACWSLSRKLNNVEA